jgi:uncharacterized protein (DUF302 family)
MAVLKSLEVKLSLPFDEAIEKVTEELKKEGFSVLTRVDIHKAFKEKIGVEFRNYTILGACNPKLAHKALSAMPEVGLLLPCNVTVESAGDSETTVRIIDAGAMMQMAGIDQVTEVAAVGTEASERLGRVAKALE